MTAPVDRAVEREKFEAQFPVPRDCIWCGNGYSATEYNAWDAHKHHDRWIGWFMRAELSAQTLASKDAEIAAMEAEIAVLRESRKFLSNMHHDIIVAMQAAWIEWQRVGDADTAMFWIQNTLAGPGLIPGEDEPYASEPQAYFDKNKSEPFPECFCGRPSNQLWMGQGFCSQAHYAEARAALTTQPKE